VTVLSPADHAAMSTAGRTAGRALVDQLVLHGVTQAFCVPGESYLEVLDALHDSPIEMTVCRQEGGVSMMAEAVGKATGMPGVCFVTRGPGATNAACGVFIAAEDSTPLIMFVGQVPTTIRGRGAWQELDLQAAFGGMAKWVVEIDDPDRTAEIISRAFHVATSGRPGPVVIGLPRDVLTQKTTAPDAEPFRRLEAEPSAADLDAFHDLLLSAERPFVILGGGSWSEEARAAIIAFAERHDLPVATSYRRSHLFDPMHRCYAGDLGLGANPALVARIRAADVVALIGGRLGEVPSQGYRLFDIPTPKCRLIHVYPDSAEIGRVYAPTLAIQSSGATFALALAKADMAAHERAVSETAEAHRAYLAWSDTPKPQPGEVNLGEVMVWLRENLPARSIICNGAGGYAAWMHRYYRFRAFNSHIAPTSASMGYGVPAAVAMKRLHPGLPVVSINGDGDFLMNGQEFMTAVQYGLPVVVVVLDNASYGSIRMFQEREYPGRVYATDLRNPDFAAYARAFGGFGATVERTCDFGAAFRAAEASGLPSIIHVKLDTEAMGPEVTVSSLRAAGQARKG
jgi:acetolactate synthase-1/2/3 large subunit